MKTRQLLISSVGLVLFLSSPLYADPPEVRDLSNRRYFDETLQAIQNARESIFLVMYHAPLDPSNRTSPVTRLAQALIEAKARGVAVRVILDQEIKSERSQKGAPMKNLRAYHFFRENGVPVSFDSLGKRTHAKLLVIDKKIVILGSANWSREAIDQNYEANLWVRSPETARAILEDFESIELLRPEKTAAPEEWLRISRNFLGDKNQGPRLLDEHAERALRLYLYLISQSTPSPPPSPPRGEGNRGAVSPLSPSGGEGQGEGDSGLAVDYDETAKLLGLAGMSREAYRRQIIKVLKKLDRDYGLVRFEPRHGKEALVTLLDPAKPGEPHRIPEEDYFEVPRALFSGGWLQTLSLRALYALLVMQDQQSYPRTSPAIEVGLETLEKRYSANRQTLGEGLRELARRNLVEIHYGKTIDFGKREFETASYVLLPFYDPLARGEKFRELEALYGKGAFQQARGHAAAFFKENDPETIETLMGLRWTYSPEWLDLAMEKVILKKSVGNPARSLPYLIGILKQWKEKGQPAFSSPG